MTKPKPTPTTVLEDKIVFYFEILQNLSRLTNISQYGYDDRTKNFTINLSGNLDDYSQFLPYLTPSDSDDLLTFVFSLPDTDECLILNQLIVKCYRSVLKDRLDQALFT